jgi:circadian clock protein KaiB
MADVKKTKPGRKYMLKLYVTGETANSIRAIANLKKILSEEFKGVYELRIIDVIKNPQLAEDDKILATPMLSRVLPLPVKRLIGDLSEKDKVLLGLDLV